MKRRKEWDKRYSELCSHRWEGQFISKGKEWVECLLITTLVKFTLIVDRASSPFIDQLHRTSIPSLSTIYYSVLHTEFIYFLEEEFACTIFQLVDNWSKKKKRKKFYGEIWRRRYFDFDGENGFLRDAICKYTHPVYREINAVDSTPVSSRDETRWKRCCALIERRRSYRVPREIIIVSCGFWWIWFVRGTRCRVKRISAKSTGNVS